MKPSDFADDHGSRPAGTPAQERPGVLGDDFLFVSRQLVMFSDLNAHGRLFGGQLVSWLDAGVAQIAMRLMRTSNIVTKKLGEIIFENLGKLGDSVEIWCRVAREGKTSLTLEARVLVRDFSDATKPARPICHSTIVYVALDAAGRPWPWKGE